MITNNGLFSSNSNVKEITLYNCKILHGKKKLTDTGILMLVGI